MYENGQFSMVGGHGRTRSHAMGSRYLWLNRRNSKFVSKRARKLPLKLFKNIYDLEIDSINE